MLKTFFFLSLMCAPLLASTIGVTIGEANSALESRVRRLENEISDLRADIRWLKERDGHHQAAVSGSKVIVIPGASAPAPVVPAAPAKTFSCYLETAFDGTFTATGKTKVEAQGKVLQECMKVTNMSMSCPSSKLKCDE